MKCMYCQAEMEKGTVPFHVERKGLHVSIDDVSAWVCPQCGESYFEEQEVDSIQSLIAALEQESRRFARSA
jgi:YgiT-type zinc finger domain-containing protein